MMMVCQFFRGLWRIVLSLIDGAGVGGELESTTQADKGSSVPNLTRRGVQLLAFLVRHGGDAQSSVSVPLELPTNIRLVTIK